MKQFIVSLLVYQFATGRYSPVVKVQNKMVRVAIFAAIFFLLAGYQIYDFMSRKYSLQSLTDISVRRQIAELV